MLDEEDKLSEYHPQRHESGSVLNPDILIILGYLLGWVGGVVVLLLEKRNRNVRFHALQSVILSLAVTVAIGLLVILGIVPLIGWLLRALVVPLLGLAYLVLVIALIIAVLNKRSGRIPVVCDFVDSIID